MIIARQTFEQMLNADDTLDKVPPNMYVHCSNMRIGRSKDGKYNLLQFIEGTTCIETDVLPAEGENKCVGTHLNTFNNDAIFFVWNSEGDHGIYVLKPDNTVARIAQQSDMEKGLGITENYYIHNIDTVGTLLYWCVPGKHPYRVNYQRLLDGEYDLPMAEPMYTLIRKPPAYPVVATKLLAEDASVSLLGNRIKNYSWRFAYRNIYKDNEISTLSPHSKLVPYNLDDNEDDLIKIEVPYLEKIAEDVKAVELVAISVPDETFRVIHEWNRAKHSAEIADHNTETENLTFFFAYDKVGETIDDANKVKPFDNVPRETGAQEVARDRLVHSDLVIGYDTPAVTSLDIAISDVPTDPDAFEGILERDGATVMDSEIDGSEKDIVFNTELIAEPDFTVDVDDKIFTYTGPDAIGAYVSVRIYGEYTKTSTIPFKLRIYKNGLPYKETFFGYPFADTPASFDITLGATINLTAGDEITVAIINEVVLLDVFYISFNNHIEISRNSVDLSSVANSLKSNASYGAGILFYDRWMRQCGVIALDTILNTDPRSAYGNDGFTPQLITWTLSNTNRLVEIPIWAWHYSIVKTSPAKNLEYFVQHYSAEIQYVTAKPEDGAALSLGATWADTHYGIAIKLTELYNSGYGYQYVAGDLLYGWFDTGSPLTFEQEVISQVGEYVICKPADLGDLTGKPVLYEIRTFKPTTPFYYEQGLIYAVNNAGTADRAYSITTATLPGDIYLLTQSFQTELRTYEAMSPSKKNWKNWVTNDGRVQIVLRIGEVRKKTGVAWSNVYLWGTLTNGLSSFESLNQEQLPISMVQVRKLILTSKAQEEGTVLMAIGERDTVSIYLGEQQLNDVSGTVFLAKSNQFIGQVNVLKGGYGTLHPESVAAERGIIIWVDAINGAVIQYASNGLFEISKYFADSFWSRWLGVYMDKSIQKPLPAVIDLRQGEYLVSLPQIGGKPCGELEFYGEEKRTVAYMIDADRWRGEYKIPAEGWLMRDNVLLSWYRAQPYLHNSNDHCWIYDQQHNGFITLAVNGGDSASTTKVYNWIEVLSNRAPDKVYMATDDPYEQRSDLYKNEFKTREGKHYAAIRRNMHTGPIPPANSVLIGEKMRGRVMLLMLQWAGGGGRIEVDEVYVGAIASKGHVV